MTTSFLSIDEIPEEFRNLSDKEPIAPVENLVEPVAEIPVETKEVKKKKQKVEKVPVEPVEPIKEDMILCFVSADREGPYALSRDGKTYTFHPPQFRCLLPKKLAELFESSKHAVRIYKG